MRVCAETDCGTVLNMYNDTDRCAAHTERPSNGEVAVSTGALEFYRDLFVPWQERAACRERPDPVWSPPAHWFFPDRTSGDEANKLRRARQVCAGCPVKRECATMALQRDADGIWAGSTYRHRRALAHLPLVSRVDVLLAEVKAASLHGPYRALNHPDEWRDHVA